MSVETSVAGDFLDYRVEEPIGQGGMGVVYLASDVRLKRKVALKLMAPELAEDDGFRERFSRESEVAMSLEHPNVVPIYDAGEADGRLYLAMRRVEGTDLRALLRREGPLDAGRALGITRQVADALDAAHARGLVHRDVKPSNVLLDESEHVYLADFGLTRRHSEDGGQLGDTRSLGTPAYIAPEQIEGGPVDGRADVYSLGCLLYECLTGEPPFRGVSHLEVAWAHLEEQPPSASKRNPVLPDAIDPVIRKAMAKAPDERYATCTELVTAAEAALGLPQPSASRRRWRTIAAAALVASLAALAVAYFGRNGSGVAGSAAAVRANTLVRVDPTTNAIAAVIETGTAPNATAVGGDSVWVYNFGDRTVSEVDPVTNEVEHTTEISTVPDAVGLGHGPLLAADADGAWVIGYDAHRARYALTRVLSGGRGKREHSFGMQLEAVTVADRTVWSLAKRDDRDLFVLRIDPRSGRVEERIRVRTGGRPEYTEAGSASAALLRRARASLGASGQGLAVGGGFLWVTEAESAAVYRLDPETGETRSGMYGEFATRPVFGFGRVWLCIGGEGSAMVRIHPRTLRNDLSRYALPAEAGQFAAGYGTVWRHDDPSGTLMRFDPRTGDPAGLIPVTPRVKAGDRPLRVTAIAAGAGGVWVTVADV